MKLSPNARILAVTLVAYIICDVLLTPAGLETRQLNGITTLGVATLVLIFIGLALIAASLVFLFRNSRLSSILATLGLLLYFPAFLADRTGYFATQGPPDAITVVEFVQVVIAVIGLGFAWRIYREQPPNT